LRYSPRNEVIGAVDGRKVRLMRGHRVTPVGRECPRQWLNAPHLERLSFFTRQMRLAGITPPRVSPDAEAFSTRPYKRSMARKMRSCSPQRQSTPASAPRRSSSLGCGVRCSSA
jgi:hypothetical protein